MADLKNLASVTTEALADGVFATEFPEYYALKKVMENSLWHDHQVVFDHVQAVLRAFETEQYLQGLSEGQLAKVTAYLAQKLESHSRLELVQLCVLCHDLAKTQTLIQHPDGRANCPGHELVGAARVSELGPRFGLTARETDHLERLVRYHGLISEFVTRVIDTDQPAENWHLFAETVGELSLDLTVMMLCDLAGSDLARTDAAQFQTQRTLLQTYLQEQADAI